MTLVFGVWWIVELNLLLKCRGLGQWADQAFRVRLSGGVLNGLALGRDDLG
jgi:hypothetical protein